MAAEGSRLKGTVDDGFSTQQQPSLAQDQEMFSHQQARGGSKRTHIPTHESQIGGSVQPHQDKEASG